MNVRADGRLITIELATLQTGRALLKTWRSRHGRGIWPGKVMTMLADSDLQLEFRFNDRMVARLGVGVRPSLSSWLLGLSPLELRPLQMLLAIASRNEKHLSDQP